MVELYDIMSNKCNEGVLYGQDYEAEIAALFDRFSVNCVVTNASGEPLISSNTNSEVLLNQLNYSMFSNDESVDVINKNDCYEIFKQAFPGSEDD